MEATELDKMIGELELGVDRLRSLYEQYFMGIERLEPTVPRKDVDRKIHALRKEQMRNTALRFRFQMVLQRYSIYQTHWQRICREIDNGTYKRHINRAQRRFGSAPPTARRTPVPPATRRTPVPPATRRTPVPPATRRTPVAPATRRTPVAPGASLPEGLLAELAELDKEFAPPPQPRRRGAAAPAPPPLAAALGAARPIAAPAPARAPAFAGTAASTPAAAAHVAAAPAAKPAAATAPRYVKAAAAPEPRAELPDDRVRQLYAQYVETRRQQREATPEPPYDTIARNLRESSARLRARHGKPVDFEVMVKDGKTFLRPVIK